ncbi:LOW QUALITY PROTEIN: protein SPT2 homolog [Rhagoletis pomonella]|uniref:protein SPT2 homolog n=1 Tax=Rhagoletis pomonella TaxID=28610 RepID=UPI00178049BD|nr:protein SPT2 homolog [Rhagoletis pomonella]XP_036345564.1 LOW QUALITY PROTEIN: protein SPT2 homolog [Rhagoletis pomonella]
MDFGTLLHVAKKNSESSKNESKYYSTKFAPPKKESKDKKLSANIQKFLQKREQEEREREKDKQQKLADLLSMRDEKSKNKIKKMLKVTKSANKSVLDDAVNSDHTAVTMAGPDQPDQDDYGYVSTEANAFYAKYIEKVKDVKEDKGFAPSRPQSLKDLSGTKERVKAAITREIEEKRGHKGQRVSSITTAVSTSGKEPKEPSIVRPSSSKSLYDPEAERREEERKKREEEQQRKKNRKPLPPPMDFQALLKLAEKKQHEPVEILPVVKKKEPERLLTMKEKKEMEERQRAKEARERRDREREKERTIGSGSTKERREISNSSSSSSAPARMEPNGRIPKLNQSTKPNTSTTAQSLTNKAGIVSVKPSTATSGTNGFKKPHTSSSTSLMSSQKDALNSHAKVTSSSAVSSSSVSTKQSHSIPNKSTAASTNSKSVPSSSALGNSSGSSKNPYGSSSNKNLFNGPSREFPPRDTKSAKPRQFPPPDVQKARQFPAPDVQRNRGKETKKPQPNKRLRIEDDDSEYDSEMDDFIDDGDEEEDYSSHIRAIFGYDKQKYRDLDDNDDAAMESNFAQVQREEYISKKIGIQEDLEDMKLEAMEKRRKMLAKKRKL